MLIEILRVVKYLKEISFLLFNNTYFNTYILTLLFYHFIRMNQNTFQQFFIFSYLKIEKIEKLKKKKNN